MRGFTLPSSGRYECGFITRSGAKAGSL